MSREYCKRLQGRDKLATFVPCSLQQQPNCIGTNNPHERSVHGSLNSFFLSAYILASKLQSLLPFSFLFLSFSDLLHFCTTPITRNAARKTHSFFTLASSGINLSSQFMHNFLSLNHIFSLTITLSQLLSQNPHQF